MSQARSSHTQARLLTTLDALDALQSSHHEEREAMTRENARVRTQLQRYKDVARAAKAERDDMKDAVLQLIEKGRRYHTTIRGDDWARRSSHSPWESLHCPSL